MKRFFFSIYILIFTFSWLSTSIFSQQENYSFTKLELKDGLSNSNINKIIQDSYGFIWIGTNDGLNKYDGYTFKYYYPDPENITKSLGHVTINTLFSCKNKSVWAGAGGLNRINLENESITNFKHASSLSYVDKDITDIVQDKNGILWLILNKMGLFTFNPTTQEFSQFTDTMQLSDNDFTSLAIDQNNNIWLGTTNGLNILNPSLKQCDILHHKPKNENSLPNNHITKIFITHDGIAWIGTKNGLSRFDRNLEHFINFTNSSELTISNNTITDICSDKNNNIWIGTKRGLNIISMKENKSIQFLSSSNNPNSISSNNINSVFTDEVNVLWIGTDMGISILDLNRKKFLSIAKQTDNNNSLSNNRVNTITTDQNGTVWVGTDYGLNKIDDINNNYKVTHYLSSENDPYIVDENIIHSLCFDVNNQLWQGGSIINKIDPENMSYEAFLLDVLDNPIVGQIHETLFSDSKNNIWSCTNEGINIINPETQKSIFLNPSFDEYITSSSGHVWCIAEDSQGVIWIGESGLIKYVPDNQSFKRYIHQDGDSKSLSNNNIKVIHVSKNENTLWIGTKGGGLNRFDPSSEVFTSFTKKQGLPSNSVIGILEDRSGNLWISTSNGLVKFNPVTSEINTYYVSDGIPRNEFNFNAFHESKDGEMFFGTSNGMLAFYPENITNNPYLPKIVINQLNILNKNVKVGQVINGDTILNQNIYATNQINLSHKNNFISFEFAALHYASPDKNSYAYQLENFDEDWIETDAKRRFCSYSNLPGGKYTFKVKASNNDGVWNEAFTFIEIDVSSPFWVRWWFISLLVVLILFIIYQYIRFREKETAQIKNELEKQVHNSIKEMETQKEELIKKNKELSKREEEEKKARWYTEGLAKFGDILSMNKESIKKLSLKLVSELVKYCNSNQGGIYVINSLEEENQFLELMAAHAYDKKKINKSNILIGEGLIGACYKEKKTKHIDSLPETYIKVSSGLGEDSSKSLIVVPLQHEDRIIGVLELAGFQPYEEYQIEFLEQLSERITTAFFTIRINEHTAKLLENAKEQEVSLKKTEESLQQNLVKMQEMQDKLDSIKLKEAEKKSELLIQISNHKDTIIDILDSFDDRIIVKDKEGKILIANSAYCEFYETIRNKIIGKTDFDFLNISEARKNKKNDLEVIKTGTQKHIKTQTLNDTITYIELIKTPCFLKNIDETGLICIQKDVTEREKLEIKIKKLEEKLSKEEKGSKK